MMKMKSFSPVLRNQNSLHFWVTHFKAFLNKNVNKNLIEIQNVIKLIFVLNLVHQHLFSLSPVQLERSLGRSTHSRVPNLHLMW